MEELQEEQLFSDFGLESVTLVKIVEKICRKYECTIQVKDILPHQTLKDASSFIYKKVTSQGALQEE